MFEAQTRLLADGPVLADKLRQWQCHALVEPAQRIGERTQHFEVLVPVVGAFSSGKSSLLNALMERRLLAAEVSPETALPCELRHGEKAKAVLVLNSGESLPQALPASFSDPTCKERLELPHGISPSTVSKWALTLPGTALAHWPHLCIVDMPGWDSGIQQHNDAIDRLIGQSMAYCVTVAADEGTLRDSIRRVLVELNLCRMPVIVVVTKGDKKPPGDLQAVAQQIEREVRALMPEGDVQLITTSARRKNTEAFTAALTALERRGETLFNRHVVSVWRDLLLQFDQFLAKAQSQDNLQEADLREQSASIQREFSTFERQQQEQQTRLQARMSRILDQLCERVQSRLMAQLDSFTSRALGGGDLSVGINETVRTTVLEAFQTQFEPALRAHLNKLQAQLPTGWATSQDLSIQPMTAGESPPISEDSIKSVLGGLVTLLPVVLKTNPITAVISTVLGLILPRLFGGPSEAERALAAARHEEAVRQRILSSLDQVVARLRPQLRDSMAQVADQMDSDVYRLVGQRRDTAQAALSQLSTQLQASQDEHRAFLAAAAADRAWLHERLAALPTPAETLA